jgi:hypothetical protein
MNILEELVRGTVVEAEHKDTYEWLKTCFMDGVLPAAHALFRHIASDHLKERVDYYERLEKEGL